MLGNNLLDVLGNQPSLHKLYTQIASIYAVTDPEVHGHIINTLRNGLDKLAESFPWLAGHVINEGASEGVTGTYRIIPTDKIPLVVKDLRDDASAPTMGAMRQARFPFSMLDESAIAPCMTINMPGIPIGLVDDHGPVFAVQANFIQGGLVLTIVGQHNAMDMVGQNNIIKWLSRACHGDVFSQDELAVGNMDKSQSVQLLDASWEPGAEIEHQLLKPPVAAEESTKSPGTPPRLSWSYVNFPPASLKALKSEATATKPANSAFVSTDDAVCAFIWDMSLPSPGKPPPRRRKYDLCACHRWALTNMTYNRSSIGAVGAQSLGSVASDLRKQLDPSVVDVAYNTRALATFLSRCADKSQVVITGCVDASSGVMLSSWAGVDLYDLDFNLGLGRPEAVRRPGFLPVESLMYIMPKSPRGEMAVAMCIRDEDWQRLKEDEEWSKFAEFIG
ncbi:Acetyltransferase [Metarhizium guizhouense ARSEF 977]|uniref:Acetyltransferase n=1 Tax=Metarhizium guizhouense (strain ARSEF 977) TaxID=1276136 RepID=A0A0B4HW75_METGA|nr:Acetyltransferase [Metarhizium guizhouense ARSEF 977]